MDMVKRSIKRGDDELYLGCLLLRLTCITLGVEFDKYYSDFFEILSAAISRGNNNQDIIHCIETLGFICLIWGNYDNSFACCDIFTELILKNSNNVLLCLACQTQLCLLYTTFSDEDALNFIEGDPAFEKITNLLILSKEYNTKIIVGATLAYFSSVVKRELNDTYSTNYFDSFVDFQNAMENLNVKPRKTPHRYDIKDILNTIQNGNDFEITLTIKKQKFTFNTWNHHLQMDAIRSTLESGFLNHLENNMLLSDIFDIEISLEQRSLNKLEKKKLFSKQSVFSYQRTNERMKNRGNKSKTVTSFLTED